MTPIQYSTASRSWHGPTPATTQENNDMPASGRFRTQELFQKDILDVVYGVLLESPTSGYEVSLSETLLGVHQSVGIIKHDGVQLGSCTLISWNLAIIPCHCIEEIDVRTLKGTFGFCNDNMRNASNPGTEYSVEGIVEYDQELDYAILKFKENPGENYGFCSFHPDAEAITEPALLHHPIGKPLKVSVAQIIHSEYKQNLLETYHDSDYGSCGGAYISPSKHLVAIHLGAERRQTDYNLVRLALPVRKIIEIRPNWIIAAFANHKLSQKDVNDQIRIFTFFVPFKRREFIDLEKYDKNMMRDDGYIVRSPNGNVPGIIIDSHQKKHLSGWPSDYHGGSGSKFPLSITNDDLVAIVEAIADNYLLFKTIPEQISPIQTGRLDLVKNLLEGSIYKKLINPPKNNGRPTAPVTALGIEYGWIKHKVSWEMHLYPETR